MFFLVCFDIVNDKDRRQAVKILKEYGVRVQKSVFECPIMTEHKFLRMKRRLEDAIDHTQDTVRYYYLCGGCVARVEFSGIGEEPVAEPFRVV